MKFTGKKVRYKNVGILEGVVVKEEGDRLEMVITKVYDYMFYKSGDVLELCVTEDFDRFWEVIA